MSIYFEKKLNIEQIKKFVSTILVIKLSEIKVMAQDYFFDRGYLEVDDSINCLCTYRYLRGSVETLIEFYKISDDEQRPEIIIKQVRKFFENNMWDGCVYVENIDDDYLCFNNGPAYPVYINDDNVDENEIFFIKK